MLRCSEGSKEEYNVHSMMRPKLQCTVCWKMYLKSFCISAHLISFHLTISRIACLIKSRKKLADMPSISADAVVGFMLFATALSLRPQSTSMAESALALPGLVSTFAVGLLPGLPWYLSRTILFCTPA